MASLLYFARISICWKPINYYNLPFMLTNVNVSVCTLIFSKKSLTVVAALSTLLDFGTLKSIYLAAA